MNNDIKQVEVILCAKLEIKMVGTDQNLNDKW